MEISTTALAPKSDQLDAVDLAATGATVFTISRVRAGSDEQPYNVDLAEFPRPWRPSKTMLRVLVGLWGLDATTWIGQRVELYCDPDVRFGADKVGGIRLRRASVGKRVEVPVIIKRGTSRMWTVDPLPDTPAGPTAADVAACTDPDTLRGWWGHRHLRPAIDARMNEIKRQEAGDGEPTLNGGDQ